MLHSVQMLEEIYRGQVIKPLRFLLAGVREDYTVNMDTPPPPSMIILMLNTMQCIFFSFLFQIQLKAYSSYPLIGKDLGAVFKALVGPR